ncbi:MAG: hypothetical protein IJN03_03585 [Bacilli bacterium]|nr:hypothetical protein [Bacilli bacterium]
MKKKILVPYATYGSGHKAIANYIEKYFKNKNEDVEILTLDLLGYSMPVVGKVTKVISEFFMLKQPFIWDVFFTLSDTKVSAHITNEFGMRLFKNKKLQKIIEEFNPDLTISTHFFGSSLIAHYNKKKIINSKIITIVTDYVAHELWLSSHRDTDYLVVCSNEEKRYLVNERDIPKDKIKTYGIPIFPETNSNFDKNKMLSKLRLKESQLTCVFFAGGGNGSTTTLPYIKRLLKQNLPLNLIFISGKNEKAEKKIKEYVKRFNAKNCKVYGYVNNVPEILQVADFVVTKPGGVQTTECLYFKKPMIMLRSSGGQENGNIKYVAKKGYGKMFRFPFTCVNYIVKVVKNPSNLKQMEKNLNRMNNQDAMDQIYKLAIKLLNK